MHVNREWLQTVRLFVQDILPGGFTMLLPMLAMIGVLGVFFLGVRQGQADRIDQSVGARAPTCPTLPEVVLIDPHGPQAAKEPEDPFHGLPITPL